MDAMTMLLIMRQCTTRAVVWPLPGHMRLGVRVPDSDMAHVHNHLARAMPKEYRIEVKSLSHETPYTTGIFIFV